MNNQFQDQFNKAKGEQYRQAYEKLSSMNPTQRAQHDRDAFTRNQNAIEMQRKAMDPNASKGMDPFAKQQAINAPHAENNKSYEDLWANMDAYGTAADIRTEKAQAAEQSRKAQAAEKSRKPSDNASVNYTNPGTSSVPNPGAAKPSATVAPVTPTAPAAPGKPSIGTPTPETNIDTPRQHVPRPGKRNSMH